MKLFIKKKDRYETHDQNLIVGQVAILPGG